VSKSERVEIRYFNFQNTSFSFLSFTSALLLISRIYSQLHIFVIQHTQHMITISLTIRTFAQRLKEASIATDETQFRNRVKHSPSVSILASRPVVRRNGSAVAHVVAVVGDVTQNTLSRSRV
jgi:hypothetical protein